MIYVAALFIIFINCLNEFILPFLGSSSTIDGTKGTFQNTLDDYDEEEESGVTMMEES